MMLLPWTMCPDRKPSISFQSEVETLKKKKQIPKIPKVKKTPKKLNQKNQNLPTKKTSENKKKTHK